MHLFSPLASSLLLVLGTADTFESGLKDKQARAALVNGKCSAYPTAYKSITACATGAKFCSNYLGHGPSTITKTVTTKTAPPLSTATSVITVSDGSSTSTSYTTTVTTTVCAAPSKRAVVAARKPGPSCGLAGFPAQTVSGACSCLNSQITSTFTKGVPARTTTTVQTTTVPSTVITVTTASTTTQYVANTPVGGPRFQLKAFDSGCGNFDDQYPGETASTNVAGGTQFAFNGFSASTSITFYLDASGALWKDTGCSPLDLVLYTDYPRFGNYFWVDGRPAELPSDANTAYSCAIDATTNEFACTTTGGDPLRFFACCKIWRAYTAVESGCSQFQLTAVYTT